jgi:hypothetical protein
MEVLNVLVQASGSNVSIGSLQTILNAKGQGLVVKVVSKNAGDISLDDYIGKIGKLMEV